MPDDRLTKMDFTLMITTERERQGLTVNAAARQAEMQQSTWYRAELFLCNTPWDTLLPMARSLGLDAQVVIIE